MKGSLISIGQTVGVTAIIAVAAVITLDLKKSVVPMAHAGVADRGSTFG